MEDPVVPFERNLYGHLLARLLWEKQFEKVLLNHGWEKIPNWECLFVHREKGLFLSVYVDDIKLAGKKQNLDPMWKLLNKEVDLGEPTSFLDHVYLGCTQRHWKTSKDIVDNYRTMFDSRISAGGVEKLPFHQNLRISSWSYDMVGHAKKCVERFCDLANKTTQQLYKISTPFIDDHHFKEEMKSIGELLQVCSLIVLKCLNLARIGRPDILWSVNKLERSITKWTKACDKRLNRLISYIHHTCEYKQFCHVGNTAKQCRLGLFLDSDFAGDLEDSKSTSGGTLCIFGSHTFVPISWMCKTQTAVSHSSTKSEIISLDIGLMLDGLPVLELWDLIASVLGNISRVSDRSGKLESDDHKHHKPHKKIDVMNDIDSVRSNVQPRANEAVIKMITKGRSPTMRHVSQTHRVALDWLIDRINLDSKIQIKYIDTKNQFADILTKGNFRRDEWNHLLNLFNISHFSSTVCTAAMAKPAQQESGEGRVTAKSRPMMNLTARTPSLVSSSASTNPGRTSYGHHEPEQPVLDDSAGRPVAKSRSNYSQEYGSSQSSQVWKSGNGEHDRSGKPEKNSWNSLEKVDPLREEHLLKLWDWKLLNFCTKDHTCLLDHHQRSHWDTITNWTRGNDELGSTVEQQPVGKLVQQSCGEVQNETFSQPTQPKPNPICDRSEKPEDTERVFVDKGKTSRSQEIDDKRLHKELGSSVETGKPEKLSKDIRVMHVHDGTGEPVKSCASTHTVKEQFVPAEHRDIHHLTRTSSTVQSTRRTLTSTSRSAEVDSETITWRQRSQLDSEDREPPSATSTSKWSSTTSSIQSFQQRITRRDQSRWKHWTMRKTRCWAKSTMQSMSVVLGRRHRLLHVRSLLSRWYDREQKAHQVSSWSLLYPELLHQEGPTTRSPIRKGRRWSRISHCESTPKEV